MSNTKCPSCWLRAGSGPARISGFRTWGNSNVYLRHDSNDRIVLTAEHRAAAAMPGVTLELAQCGGALALRPVQQPRHQPDRGAEPTSVDQRITATLVDGDKPRPFFELRASCRARTTTLYDRLAATIAAVLVVKSPDGYGLATRYPDRPAIRPDADMLNITLPPNPARTAPHCAPTTSHFRSLCSLQSTGSGSGKPIKKRAFCHIRKRVPAQYALQGSRRYSKYSTKEMRPYRITRGKPSWQPLKNRSLGMAALSGLCRRRQTLFEKRQQAPVRFAAIILITPISGVLNKGILNDTAG
jgi:hypothetical protein